LGLGVKILRTISRKPPRKEHCLAEEEQHRKKRKKILGFFSHLRIRGRELVISIKLLLRRIIERIFKSRRRGTAGASKKTSEAGARGLVDST